MPRSRPLAAPFKHGAAARGARWAPVVEREREGERASERASEQACASRPLAASFKRGAAARGSRRAQERESERESERERERTRERTCGREVIGQERVPGIASMTASKQVAVPFTSWRASLLLRCHRALMRRRKAPRACLTPAPSASWERRCQWPRCPPTRPHRCPGTS